MSSRAGRCAAAPPCCSRCRRRRRAAPARGGPPAGGPGPPSRSASAARPQRRPHPTRARRPQGRRPQGRAAAVAPSRRCSRRTPRRTWRDALVGLQESNAPCPSPRSSRCCGPSSATAGGSCSTALRERAAAAASLGQVHRATWARRPAGGGQGAVPGRARGAGRRRAHAVGCCRGRRPGRPWARRAAAGRRAARPADRGAGLPARGRGAGALRRRVRRRPGRRRARGCVRATVARARHGLARGHAAGRGGPHRRRRPSATAPPRRYQRFLVSGPERVGLLHTDPHPGNFRVLPDGRLGVLDFGSTLALPRHARRRSGGCSRRCSPPTARAVLDRLREDGFVRPGRTVDVRQAGRLHGAVHACPPGTSASGSAAPGCAASSAGSTTRATPTSASPCS